jgi:ferredoxin--NADP+ reductase
MTTSAVPPTRRRAVAYNATVEKLVRVHDHLMILRTRSDGPMPAHEPGQYVLLGLGAWEPMVGGPPAGANGRAEGELVMRAYSISSSLLDDSGHLVRQQECGYLEFYIALVPQQAGRAPGLTARLFALEEGGRLFVGPRAHGRYTLGRLGGADAVVLAGTGTGEAPHNAMLAELLATGFPGPIVVATCVRRRRDLAYLAQHRELERRYPNYRYVALTTREPENTDARLSTYVGRRYLQDCFADGSLERETGVSLRAEGTHVFLCGNPAMIGLPKVGADGERTYPQPAGMIEVLESFGLNMDLPGRPGRIHFEKYW